MTRHAAESDAKGELIVLQFRALPSDVPAPVRVRAMLKRALRSFQLQCVRVIGLPDSWAEKPAKIETAETKEAI